MLILAADTSLSLLSVALLRDSVVLGAVALEGKSSRNEKLLPAIDWVLAENGVDRRVLDLLAVTRGPGSFTGVRIGLATMQGLALAIERPLCAMSTHEAIALGEGAGDSASLVPQLDRVGIIDDVGRGESYISIYDHHRETTPPRLARPAEVDELLADCAIIIRVADYVQHANVAAGCARRALDVSRSGALDAYSDPTPIYVRLAEAEVKLQQKTTA